ncbi:penicillin-binding transpeptidase domain-containing protein [Patescibacteria group bacterium]|nr:penicillin-binding transpeptidase domain-containing protein [Patescibacteria group bacterium]
MKKLFTKKKNFKSLYIVLGVILVILVYTFGVNTGYASGIVYTAYNINNPLPSIAKPKASTTIYAGSTVIGKIYPPEMNAYYYEQNKNTYKGKSILYHLENLYPYSTNPNILNDALTLRKQIIGVLKNTKAITKSQYQKTQNINAKPYFTILHAPYFTEYVINKLYQNYSKYVLEGGLKVYTTVNLSLNSLAQSIVTTDTQKYLIPVGASDAALVADNPQNGNILAMIGGSSYAQSQINMADVPRQQGSAMKPLIYVKAFEMGYSPHTMIDDSPVCFGNYCPTDYEGYTVGWVSIDRAINQSINIPAIKMFNRIGYYNGLNTLLSEGIKLNKNVFYGLPLVLGAAGIPLVRMVGAYNALNNGGYYAQSTPFLKITYDGKTILDTTNTPKKRILNANAVAEMDYVLGNTALKQPMYNYATYYYSVQGRPYGSKDGTSNGPRDITDYMFIPQITVGVWAGNESDSLLSGNAVGAFQTGPIAHSLIMDYIAQNHLPVIDYPTPIYPTLNATTSRIP